MNFLYDPDVDALSIQLSSKPYSESDEVRENVIFDYDADGKLIQIEILEASRMFPAEFQTKKSQSKQRPLAAAH